MEGMPSTKSNHGKRVGRGSSWRARQEHRRRVRLWVRVGFAAVVVAGVAAAIGGLILANGSKAKPADDGVTVIQLQLGDYFIAGDLEVPAGRVRIKATNVGVLTHNVGVRRGPISRNLLTGETAALDLGELAPGTYELYCDVDDHTARGMVATLHVTEPVPGPTETSSPAAGK